MMTTESFLKRVVMLFLLTIMVSLTGRTQTLVVPNAYTSTGGPSTFLGPLANTPRTYQLLVEETQLTSAVGRRITAISWRIPSSATADWPTAEVVFTSYDIYLSGSVTPANRSFTFIENVVGPQTQVRSGGLTIPMNSYPSGGSPNGWGPAITLTTPWVYTGGHLLVEIRHSGFTGTSRSADAAGTGTSGYGTLFSAAWQSGSTATSGMQGNFSVFRLTTDTVTVDVGEDYRIPHTLNLAQNYPNPFNPSTLIHYELPVAGDVELKVFTLLGQEVATLVRGQQNAGTYSVDFTAGNLASGVYVYRLIAGGHILQRKMLLLK